MAWLVRPSIIAFAAIFVYTLVGFLLVTKWSYSAFSDTVDKKTQFTVALVLRIRDDVLWLKELVDKLAPEHDSDSSTEQANTSAQANKTKSYKYVEKIIKDIETGAIDTLTATIGGPVVASGEILDVNRLRWKPLITLGPNKTNVVILMLILPKITGTPYLAWMAAREASGIPVFACYDDTLSSKGPLLREELTTLIQKDGFANEDCARDAKKSGWPVYGIKNGKECWAGPTIPVEYFRVRREDCNLACPGGAARSGETCGGTQKIQIARKDDVDLKLPNYLYTTPGRHPVVIIAYNRPSGTVDKEVRQFLDPPYNRTWTTLHNDAAGLVIYRAVFFYVEMAKEGTG